MREREKRRALRGGERKEPQPHMPAERSRAPPPMQHGSKRHVGVVQGATGADFYELGRE